MLSIYLTISFTIIRDHTTKGLAKINDVEKLMKIKDADTDDQIISKVAIAATDWAKDFF